MTAENSGPVKNSLGCRLSWKRNSNKGERRGRAGGERFFNPRSKPWEEKKKKQEEEKTCLNLGSERGG